MIHVLLAALVHFRDRQLTRQNCFFILFWRVARPVSFWVFFESDVLRAAQTMRVYELNMMDFFQDTVMITWKFLEFDRITIHRFHYQEPNEYPL